MWSVIDSSKFSPVNSPSHGNPLNSSSFARLELPLARAGIDRAGDLRVDAATLDELWNSARILLVVREITTSQPTASGPSKEVVTLKFATDGAGQPSFYSSGEILEQISTLNISSGEKLFLGFDGTDSYFAYCSDAHHELPDSFRTLREIGDNLSDSDIGLAVHAQALANWHHTHTHCPRCGSTTTSSNGGSVRRCDADGSEHYPRTDPAIIVLVKDKNDRILLGRQKVWPQNRFSNFAGFVDAGESFEHCVVREVGEEAGVRVSDIIYLGSQPWPFPASVMIAFHAITDNPEAARPDGEEIEEIRWYDRATMKQDVASQNLLLPPAMSVARKMIEAWYSADGLSKDDLAGGESWRPN
jgi:NAD+ diphosphatase